MHRSAQYPIPRAKSRLLDLPQSHSFLEHHEARSRDRCRCSRHRLFFLSVPPLNEPPAERKASTSDGGRPKQKPNRRPSKRRQESCSALCRKIHIATDERLYPYSRRHHDQVDVKPLLAVETSVLGDRERRGSRRNGGGSRPESLLVVWLVLRATTQQDREKDG